MDEPRAGAQEAACFLGVLSPNRSLSRAGFVVLLGAISVLCLGVGAVLWVGGVPVVGIWPVFLFLGLVVVGTGAAFGLNYRAGRRIETVELFSDSLVLTRVGFGGGREVLEFNPYWVRVRLSQWRDGRLNLALVSHGREVVFGQCLSDVGRREFARALERELEKVRAATGSGAIDCP